MTPLMRRIALKTNFVDRPNAAHKSHDEPIPYLGGVAIILGVLLITYGALLTQENMKENIWTATSLFGPALILGIVGLIDDRRALPPLPRFIAQSAAGIFTAVLILATDTVGNPSGNSLLDAFITIVWIVGISNSINFFDNLDGGAAGAVAATSFGLFLITYNNSQFLISASAITLFAAMLGFLIWNKSPAKIYMGDAGALFLGTVIAVLTIRLDPAVESKAISFSIPLLLLAVPILDTSVAVLSRIRRKKSIFEGGHDHLSHRLMRKGFTKRQSAYALWSLAAIFAGIATTIATKKADTTFLVGLSALFWFGLFVT
ncbi:MAG: undecaprenyl/decaprenyl-phosphate alpha-N-acetylglucosaminyl 1-phosphate transferase, partial [Actinobacteria bacterium]|nr:undecaprenyl/decaprenyl-phosphate alpha-N-acetylglucosaminyl 1-phosphate transferase [Actinomycetota bacterium]